MKKLLLFVKFKYGLSIMSLPCSFKACQNLLLGLGFKRLASCASCILALVAHSGSDAHVGEVDSDYGGKSVSDSLLIQEIYISFLINLILLL